MLSYIYFNDFCDAFRRMDRTDHFSEKGMQALYDYLQEIDDHYHLDVIGLCSQYQELSDKELEDNENPDLIVRSFDGGAIVEP